MKDLEGVLKDLFGTVPIFLFELDGFNRNSHTVYSIENKKIIVKEFREKEVGKREKFFYEILKEICKIPNLYLANEDIIVTDFIESEKPDILSAVKDWTRIHSNFLDSDILTNPILAKHRLKNLSKYIDHHQEMFGPDAVKLSKVLVDESREFNSPTIIHGDLYGKNILTRNGENYYIDFEFSGVSHPVRDLALILLNYPRIKEELIRIYRENISFDYKGIEEDIKKELLGKGVQLIAGLKGLKMPVEKKREIHRNLLRVMGSYLN